MHKLHFFPLKPTDSLIMIMCEVNFSEENNKKKFSGMKINFSLMFFIVEVNEMKFIFPQKLISIIMMKAV